MINQQTSDNLQRTLLRRRVLLYRLLSLTSLPVLWSSSATVLHADNTPVHITDSLKQRFMGLAMEMKRKAIDAGDQAYGAIVVRGDKVVGEGPSRVVVDRDPTAHAEIVAIRDAARRLDRRDLNGCVIFATSRPCRMCETASYWASIDRLFYSAAIVDGGEPQYDSC